MQTRTPTFVTFILGIVPALVIAGTSAVAWADRQPPRPEEQAPTDKTDKPDEKDESAKDESAKDDKTNASKDAKPEDKADAKSGSCSVTSQDDAMFGFAALVLLVSGVALRRTAGRRA